MHSFTGLTLRSQTGDYSYATAGTCGALILRKTNNISIPLVPLVPKLIFGLGTPLGKNRVSRRGAQPGLRGLQIHKYHVLAGII